MVFKCGFLKNGISLKFPQTAEALLSYQDAHDKPYATIYIRARTAVGPPLTRYTISLVNIVLGGEMKGKNILT
jgi:hypothetical protein